MRIKSAAVANKPDPAAAVLPCQPALVLAAKACAQYRRRGGSKGQVLPDFLIGVHAAVKGWPLLTRDASRFRTYFPTLEVLAP